MSDEIRSDSLYPNLTDLLTDRDRDRAKFMLDKRKDIERQLTHYKKVKNKWGKLDTAIKAIGLILVFGTTIAGVIIGTAGLAAPLILGVLAGVAAGETVLSESISIGLTSRKKVHFRQRYEVINSYLNKLHIYFEKCRNDGVISIEELEGFNLMVAKMDENMPQSNVETSFKHLTKKDIKHVEKEVRIEKRKQEIED